MAILQLYPKKIFYARVNQNEFRPGQFCWLPVPHIDPVPRILDIKRSSSTEHDNVSFELRNANQPDDFRTRDRILPLKRLDLRSNEELLAQRAKKRPGIIISPKVDIFSDIARLLRQKGKKHLQEDCLFVIPGYTIETEDSLSGFPQEMVTRIRCLIYRQFFYFPGSDRFTEGVARFDRIQVVIGRDTSAISPTDICLSDEVYGLFRAMLIHCITGKEDKDLKAAKDICRETYQEGN